MTVSFRPITPGDQPFLCALYASTRHEELAATNWPPEQVEAFLRMQFELQHVHYTTYYPTADLLVIELDGTPIGRLYLDRWEDEFRLMDIALVPALRNRGLGTQLVRNVLAEAARAGLPVRIHVEKFNPALRLYRRLGFREVEDKGVYLFMEARAGVPVTADAPRLAP